MAISKILYIGDCGARFHGKHLKQALDYIADREKTDGGRWVSSLNCQTDYAYEQMCETKKFFGKTDQRQGYHLIISFVEGEVDAKTAFEIIGSFAEEYLGQDYEALYAVHDNTDHIHGHVIFNSVSFRTGRKYRYEKGDWAKKIQPITNRICEKYGLSTIEIEEDRVKLSEHYKEWSDFRDGKFVWSDMIKRDIDACILQAPTYESFLSLISEMGYEMKNTDRSEGKYLAIKPMGMTRFRRCKSLGEEYTEERIRERIQAENLSSFYNREKENKPRLVYCKIRRYKRAKMSGIQKRYFAKLYRIRQLRKRSYSQVWKYRDEIRKMKKLQEDYLFLSRHNVRNEVDVAAVAENMLNKKKETAKEKSRIFKERARMKPLFDLMKEMDDLKECENCFTRGETLFSKEHDRWMQIGERLKKEGYSIERLSDMKEHYRSEIARIRVQEAAVAREERIAKRIIAELLEKDTGKIQEVQRKVEKEKTEHKEREKSRQPKK